MIKMKFFALVACTLFVISACSLAPLVSKPTKTRAQPARSEPAQMPKMDTNARLEHSTEGETKPLYTPLSLPLSNPATNSEFTADRPATIVFVRASVAASAVPADIYQLEQGRPRFLAASKNNTRVHHSLAPGRHVFMLVAGESIDYIEVDITGNKYYYCLVKPRMGVWRPSFALLPIKKRQVGAAAESAAHSVSLDDQQAYYYGDEFVEVLLGLSMPVVYTDATPAITWADVDVRQRHQQSWARWQSLAAEEKARKRLSAEDGR